MIVVDFLLAANFFVLHADYNNTIHVTIKQTEGANKGQIDDVLCKRSIPYVVHYILIKLLLEFI